MSDLQQISGALIDWLTTTSWQACVVVGAVLLAQGVFRRWLPARWRYALWGLLVARLLMPVAPASSSSVFNLLPDGSARGGETAAARSGVKVVVTEVGLSTNDLSSRGHVAGGAARWDWRPILAAIWLAGAAGMGLLVLRSRRRLARQLRGGRVVSDTRLISLLGDCRRRMRIRRPVEMIELDGLPGPAIAGVFRPRLLLPRGMAEGLGDEQMRLIFLHELAHVRCRDASADCLLDLLLIINWFNPAVWFAMARMRADRELARDEMVLSAGEAANARPYGLAILGVVERFSGVHAARGFLGMAQGKRQLARRLHMIAEFRPAGIARAAFSVVLMLAIGCATLTGRKSAEAGEPAAPAARQDDAAPVLKPAEKGSGPTIMVEMRMLSITEKGIAGMDAKTRAKWRLEAPVGEKAAVAVVSEVDIKEMLASARDEKSGVSVVTAPKVVVYDGQEAVVQIGSEVEYISDYTAEKSPDGQTIYKPMMSTVEDGFRISVRPTAGKDGKSATVEVRPRYSHVRGMNEAPFKGEAEGAGGKKLMVQIPTVEVVEVEAKVNVADGGSFAISNMAVAGKKDGEAPARLVSIVTTSIAKEARE